MNNDQFRQKVDEFRERIARIYQQNYPEIPTDPALAELYESLNSSLEELQVAEEELRQQNEELASAQISLEEERKRYRDLFEFAPDGYLVTDIKGIIQEANHAAINLLEIPQEDLQGMPLSSFINEPSRSEFHTLLRTLGHSEEFPEFETRLYPERVPRVDISLKAGISHSLDGATPNVLWLLRNITSRKISQRLLADSEARFHTIFDQAGLGIELISLTGQIIETNPAFQKMIGYSADELRQMNFDDFTHSEDIQEANKLFQGLVAGKYPQYRIEKRYLRKDGSIIWGRLTSAIYRVENIPRYAIGLIENITLQKQMENELSELQRRLYENIEAERMRLARELHDGPIQDLYGVSFQLSGIDKAIVGPNVQPDLANASETVQKVIELLRAICGELRPPTLAPFGLEKAIRSHAEMLQGIHQEISLELDLMKDEQKLPERVRLTLFRIYQQLILNVVRHASAKKVTIRFQFDDENIFLEVKDDGRGFMVPARWIELVRKSHFGLAGAVERAEALGGHLKVISRPGQGTFARVDIPRLVKSE